LCSGRLDFPLHDVAAAREDLQTLIVDDAHLLDDDSRKLAVTGRRELPNALSHSDPLPPDESRSGVPRAT
jgi:hypothetical protein